MWFRPILTALLLLPGASLAQTDADRQQVTTLAQEIDNPSLSRSPLAALSAITVEAGVEDSKGRIRLSRPINHGSLALTLSTAANKDKEKATDLASLDGLASTLNLSLSASRFFYGTPNPAVADAQNRVCERAGVNIAVMGCDDNAVRSANPRYVREFMREGLLFRRIPVLSGELAAGYNDAEFFNQSTLDKEDQRYLSFSGSASIGLLTPDTFSYLQVRIESKLTDGAKVEQCMTDGTDPFQSCTTLPLGRPTRDEGVILSAGLRMWGAVFALDPRVNVDVLDGTVGVELPAYLLKDSAGRFTGGLRLGWRSDNTDNIQAAVFVTAPLGIGL